jgi:uncharacterized protein
MLLFLRTLLLLWLINFAPPFLAHLLEDKWNTPLDLGRRFKDGKPLLGPHKTLRGVLGAIVTGMVMGLLLGFPWWLGFLTGLLSMVGDCASSFIKRRWGWESGKIVPGLDQVFESLLPFAVLAPYYSLDGWKVLFLVVVFSAGAYVGSWFFKNMLLRKPYESYGRRVRTRTRLREIRACQVTSKPLHQLLNFEDAIYYHFIMKTAFRLMGLYEKGKQNALDVQHSSLTFHFRDLPPSFEDFTILFLSDLHLDGLDGLTERLQALVTDLPLVDLCILGGDFRMETHGPFAEALDHLQRLLPHIRARHGILGVLGNHDCLEIVPELEKLGTKFLINESVEIDRNGDKIWIVGVDDPHYYKSHDVRAAFEDVPPLAFTIFVAHSNEIYREASEYDPRLYLCGHTHAGQIQIPPFGPIFTHSHAPRKLCRGTWRHENMTGYTSCGVGVSGIPVRFSSQGEIVTITLKGNHACLSQVC